MHYTFEMNTLFEAHHRTVQQIHQSSRNIPSINSPKLSRSSFSNPQIIRLIINPVS